MTTGSDHERNSGRATNKRSGTTGESIGATGASRVEVDLTAVIVSMHGETPSVLEIRPETDALDHLPRGPLQPEHRTLQAGLRNWVERQTRLSLGYVEQLYTFGDSNRAVGGQTAHERGRTISVAYLALVHADDVKVRVPGASWRGWYDYLPWEDWRGETAEARTSILDRLDRWTQSVRTEEERRRRSERVRLAFGAHSGRSEPGRPDEERVLERYELLYSAGLLAESWYDAGKEPTGEVIDAPGRPMAADHRRILATAIGRLRGKIKYRPVLFELMPQSFTLLQLQRTAEALSGVQLHKQNFRRLVHNQQLVEETGEVESATGGRPARLMRFRPEVVLERPSPGVRVSATRRASLI